MKFSDPESGRYNGRSTGDHIREAIELYLETLSPDEEIENGEILNAFGNGGVGGAIVRNERSGGVGWDCGLF